VRIRELLKTEEGCQYLSDILSIPIDKIRDMVIPDAVQSLVIEIKKPINNKGAHMYTGPERRSVPREVIKAEDKTLVVETKHATEIDSPLFQARVQADAMRARLQRINIDHA
jgi:hypothetical protein